MKFIISGAAAGLALIALAAARPALAEAPGDPAAVTQDADGVWRDKKNEPTYKITDGVVDFATFSGYRRYHSECHVCHGPDGEGSTYAPALSNSLKTMDYAEFAGIVIGGRTNFTAGKENVMPALGDNKNVTCYLIDIYVYLRARSQGAVDRGRPAKRADKPASFDANEAKCMAAD